MRALARTSMGVGAPSVDESGDDSLDTYVLVNHGIGVGGLALLPLVPWLAGSDRMTAALLSVGIFFLLQLSTLVSPGVRRLASLLSSVRVNLDATGTDARRATKLLSLAGAVPVGIAVLLVLCYLVLALTAWEGEVNTHLVKMAVFTGTQLLFCGSVALTLASLRRASADQVEELYQNARRIVPLMVYGSIMISVYYFGKEFLAAVEGPRFRPAMMSAFLQLLAVGVFHALFFGWDQTSVDQVPS